MPKSTMVEENEYPVPAGVPFAATLQAVTVRTIEFFKKDQYGNKTSQKDSFDKWIWEFKISDGDYAGVKLYGETEDKLTSRDDNVVRQWAETLLGGTSGQYVIEIGQGLDTDTLIGLPCTIMVRHDEPRQKRDGTNFYPCPVDEVFPPSGASDYPSF